ncbi:hypothetical protein Tco_0551081 [Tanacetum coccineum]
MDTTYRGFLGLGTMNRYAVSSLMDMAYWMPEQLKGLQTKEKSPKVEKPTNEEIVKEFGLKSLGDIPLDEFGGADAKRFPNSYDGSLVNDDSLSDQVMQEADSDLEYMPGDEIESLSGFEADESDNDDCQSMHKEELSKTDEAAADNIHDEIAYMANSENENVADKIKDSVPRLVADAFKERIPDLLSETLKNTLPQIIKGSIKQALPSLTNEHKITSIQATSAGENKSTQSNKDSENTDPAQAQEEHQPNNYRC